ncbi:MAG: HAD family hydrolase [Verrucomicrobiota bacterium JB024]|nr:HAD family hydrolase [Verrucomicrobiota bacterium JB024]
MSAYQIDYTARHPRLIACDSDGCAFDVMDLKHKECFCPAFIKHFGLQRCARQARQVWEFVNLYSRTRGSNRFQAVGDAVKLLAAHPEVRDSGLALMDFEPIHHFLAHAEALGEPALARKAEATGAPALQAMLFWTREVNIAVKAMCHGIGPFPGVEETLRAASQECDVLVVSQAPRETLIHEWTASGLAELTATIAGQEFGSKAAQVEQALASNPSVREVLVLGDAPGDQQAAEATGAKFFPIIPGDEIASWERLRAEGLPRFLRGEFDAAYQSSLLDAFSCALPDTPPWQQ